MSGVGKPFHQNNFGLLRLVFAFLVIVSHSIQLVDGNRSREPLTNIFGTTAIGDLGVYGFFIVSGYLIAQSFERSLSVASYLWKRALRIYPAFIVSSVVCLTIVAPMAGAEPALLLTIEGVKALGRMLLLRPPALTGTFPGIPYSDLNGSMYTIAYEFRCYLLVIAIGLLGPLTHRLALLGLTIAALLATVIPFSALPLPPGIEFFVPSETARLTAPFLCGCLFYAYRDKITYRSDLALAVAGVLMAMMFVSQLAAAAVAILGAYLVFWFAFLPDTPRLHRINNRDDISYGTYLYAWPIQNLLIWYFPGISPWWVMAITTITVLPIAYASWKLIEEPSNALRFS